MAAATRKKHGGRNKSSVVVAIGATTTATTPTRNETKSQSTTPPRVPAQAERGEAGRQEPIAGIFPFAGPRPLPAVVLQSVFGWLLSSDLSALRVSSVAAASPGEMLRRVRTIHSRGVAIVVLFGCVRTG